MYYLVSGVSTTITVVLGGVKRVTQGFIEFSLLLATQHLLRVVNFPI